MDIAALLDAVDTLAAAEDADEARIALAVLADLAALIEALEETFTDVVVLTLWASASDAAAKTLVAARTPNPSFAMSFMYYCPYGADGSVVKAGFVFTDVTITLAAVVRTFSKTAPFAASSLSSTIPS